jgi:serine/threonine-protein kinase
MASVHLGRMKGHAGFSRTVAVKQLHASFSEDPGVLSTLLDEARLASRIQHPNVVATLDVVAEGTDVLLVLEYLHGESLSRLLRAAREPPPIAVAKAIVAGALHGLHAAHEAKTETGESLGIVHRDVSPHNVFVGVDGLARMLDFGVAKARGQLQTTREGQVKGKLAYMAPEQIKSGEVSRRTDVFAAGIVLWETLTGQRLFRGENEGHLITRVLAAPIPAPSTLRTEVDAHLDAIVLRALDRDPEVRFATTRAFALALEEGGVATPSAVGEWVEETAHDTLAERAARVAAIEQERPDRPASSAAHDPTSTATATPEGEATASNLIAIAAPARTRKVGVTAVIAACGVAVAVGVWAWSSSTSTPAIAPAPTETAAPASEPPETSETSTKASDASEARSNAPAVVDPPTRPTAKRAARRGNTATVPSAPAASATASAKAPPFYRFE